ncbi:LysE family translocator [Candidatus Pelagibacter sp. HIMB1517]|jgi:threonine/homoserine/homoserine lactone efflux protein|uniref:LysE family translocator n=1 Tax=Candidatus Pelagibacter sp. HIMB1517 TaxID=3413341 RepID=UPI003F831AF2
MSITELYFYAFAMFILFLTPGPVWVVLLARIFSNGWSGGLPLACGVIIADFTWSFLAVISISSISEAVPSITKTLTWVAAGFFLYLAIKLWLKPSYDLNNIKLSKVSSKLKFNSIYLESFMTGLLVNFSNPKAILFYISIMPGFFVLNQLTNTDAVIIASISALVPFIGNIILIALVSPVRQLMQSPSAQKKLNQISSILLLIVAVMILVL